MNRERAADVRHAWPFRMIDRVVEGHDGRCSVVKLVSADETLARARPGGDPVPGHIPSFLLIEALVQAALPLASESPVRAESDAAGDGAAPGLLVSIHAARIHGRIEPGDILTITATLTARWGGLVRVNSRAEVSGRSGTIAEGEFTIATGADSAGDSAGGERWRHR